MKKVAALATLLTLTSALAAAPKDTLVYQSSSDIPTLDPGVTYDTASGGVVENIYETLVSYSGASLSKLEPLLATKWTISNGGKTYTFDLRKGVKFHSGNAMTCADAEYTFERNLVTNSAESGNWFLAESLLGTGANADDDKTITWARIDKAVECNGAGQLIFNLPAVDPAFLAKLAFSGQSVVDSKHAAGLGEWNGKEATWKDWVGKDLTNSKLSQTPSGTGAYKLVRKDSNTLLATAFDGYWGKKPAIKNIVIQKVSELAARQQAFLRGDADLIDGGGRAVDETQVKGKAGVAWIDNLENTLASAFFMNQNIKNPALLGSGKLDGKGIPATFFKDANVRRAFSYAFDYQKYITDVQKGKGKQRTMLLPEIFGGYDAKVSKYSYDKAKAESFFKRAYGGQLWKNGFTLTANYRQGNEPAQKAMEILKANVEALNPKFRINIQAKQWSEMLKDSKDGKEAMTIMGWAPDYADPDNFMYTFYSSNGYYNPRLNWKDAQIDKWLEQARSTVNNTERNRLYSLVGKKAFEQAPYILMPAGIAYIFMRDNLVGVSASNYNPMISFSATGTFWKELSKK
ncbi:extracellular solute-binding protein [Deinococcus grandis]|uniref:Extracellular solute-binding protein n=1 Tax=Deinococcus grandis TaxID=57498 RepID=A0A100HH93_9DEIO|nr:ABC transporter substrate-binding protein [Deinococcus grandis]BBN95836.1 peptide ABC transporter substrate-binding protein [Deinococcus grandis]GAQ20681.1 extracellular solute-binding protein [Deinococcus grandis]